MCDLQTDRDPVLLPQEANSASETLAELGYRLSIVTAD
jgi:hypothetical protein